MGLMEPVKVANLLKVAIFSETCEQVKVEVAITMIAIHLCQLAMNVGPRGCQLLPVEPADTAMCFIAGSACKSNWI